MFKRNIISMVVPALLAANARREPLVLNTFGETMPTRAGATIQRNSLVTNSQYILQTLGHALGEEILPMFGYSARRAGRNSFAMLQYSETKRCSANI